LFLMQCVSARRRPTREKALPGSGIHRLRLPTGVRTNTSREYTCVESECCAQTVMRFSSALAFSRHMIGVHGKKPFDCEICGVRYNKKVRSPITSNYIYRSMYVECLIFSSTSTSTLQVGTLTACPKFPATFAARNSSLFPVCNTTAETSTRRSRRKRLPSAPSVGSCPRAASGTSESTWRRTEKTATERLLDGKV
jgi:hypothetical protein